MLLVREFFTVQALQIMPFYQWEGKLSPFNLYEVEYFKQILLKLINV